MSDGRARSGGAEVHGRRDEGGRSRQALRLHRRRLRGCDSSYLVWLMVQLALRPLAVHFDNTWNSPIATNNIYNVLDALNVDLETLVVDNREYDDLYRVFMLAGVPDIEAPTDIGFMGTLYRAAERHHITHIVEGHSFRSEGISQLAGSTWTASTPERAPEIRHAAVDDVPEHAYGELPQVVGGEVLQGHMAALSPRLRQARRARFLIDELGWQWYGGHHLENRFTAFYHSYFMPRRWGIDMRSLELSAFARTGVMDRADAADVLNFGRACDPQLLALVKKRLGFDDEEFDAVMTLPKRSYGDYTTYKRRFGLMKPLWWALYKADRVPKSFYVKFAGGRG